MLLNFFLLILILLWLCLFLLRKINLTTADLGRHLKNGQLFFQHDYRYLTKNLYSYTLPQNQFLNYHCASGPLSFFIYKFSGFTGHHLFFIFLTIVTFLIFFFIAEKESSFATAFLFFLPLLEIFWVNSHIYFFLGLFLITAFLCESLFVRVLKKISAGFIDLFFNFSFNFY